MSKAYVDTTILVNILLKVGDDATNAKNALKRYISTELPVYAIKELKAGALKNFVWMHNKFAIEKSYVGALDKLQRMSLTPRRYTTATAIEALKTASGSLAKNTPKSLATKYGDNANQDKMLADEYRLALKTIILKAWKKRRKVTTDVVNPLPCYKEKAPYEERGLLILDPVKCPKENECCMASQLKAEPEILKSLKQVIDGLPKKAENTRRSQALRKLYRKPKEIMTDDMCRDLGDAIFAFFSPDDADILTTNTRDHEPLAICINKKVSTP